MQEVQSRHVRVLPHNLDVERALLGSVLLNADVLPHVLELVGPSDFYKRAHGTVFSTIVRLFEKHEPVDVLTVKDELATQGLLEEVGGETYLSDLLDSTLTSVHAAHYAQIVKEKSLLRNAIKAAEEIVSRGYGSVEDADEFLAWAEGCLLKVSEERGFSSYHRLNDVVNLVLKDIEKIVAREPLDRGVRTGFSDLDKIIISLQPTDLVIVAARPGMGKTAFCLNVAEHVAIKEGKGVGIFSLEMSKKQIGERMLCSLARIDFQRMRGGFVSPGDFKGLVNAAALLSDAPVFVDDSPSLSSLEVRAKARRMKHELKGNLGLIIVDYLQLMRGRERTEVREQEISEISRSLKQLAKELSIPVIAISQLNRAVEGRTDKRPQLADLRESGALEQVRRPRRPRPRTARCRRAPCPMHVRQKEKGVRTLDIAKRLLDYGFHAPTIYFPLIVSEALMIEPTETESLETLKSFIDTLYQINLEIEENPEVVKTAPHKTPVKRLDETRANREPDLCQQ